jgi:hypothetical protein
VREIRTLRAMWRGLETTHGSDTEALSTETESKQSRPNLRSIGASPRPYRVITLDQMRCPSVSFEQMVEFLRRDAGQQRGIGDFVSV